MILVELNYVEIGNRIAQRRIHAGIKQTNLAETVGISNNYLSSIERGKDITDGLRLCSENDLDLILAIVQIMVRRSSDRWNSDNYF